MNFSDLKAYQNDIGERRIAELFTDQDRAQSFSTAALGLVFDWSKTALDDTSVELLLNLAETTQVAQHRAAMFSGEKINVTEDRAVLHTALRAGGDASISVDGEGRYARGA